MIDDSDDEWSDGYAAGSFAARGEMAADLRRVVDHITGELRALRREVCIASGQTVPDRIDPLDQVNDRGRPQ